MRRFEFVTKYKDSGLSLPERKTKDSAGYDFIVAEDTIVPSYYYMHQKIVDNLGVQKYPLSLNDVSRITKQYNSRLTLVPTGVKCYLNEGEYLELSMRSSAPLKHWLIMGNSVGIIDKDYADSDESEGMIYFQIINLFPYPILLKKGDIIGQGIIKHYEITDNDNAKEIRTGGFGSTSK